MSCAASQPIISIMLKTLVRIFMRLVARVLFRVTVRNTGDAGSGFDAKKLLIVANHESFLDGLLLGLFLPVDPVFIVHTGVAKESGCCSA